ncbi:hypothetical protein DGI_0362 [Megalodesulfovibrio gigas DSM 1382 = ATCC 19364]|uniref:Uncharacterized protein n=1 Tax=Megalodesulfovibrio gigas (strain ATCC 19364 / DSM 1382 / NCIMB 9332 / VKM B-1759) TaxID=1121448 RepID=T2G7L4_MEGG1|nr:hypothetical protein DGI_0362 [Megalodesulfovibrio gigas DSM 1382 = ATCC 19364]
MTPEGLAPSGVYLFCASVLLLGLLRRRGNAGASAKKYRALNPHQFTARHRKKSLERYPSRTDLFADNFLYSPAQTQGAI